MRKGLVGLCALLMVLLIPDSSDAQSVELPLLAHLNEYPSVGYSAIWGYTAPDGREYALLGVQSGTSVVDITDAPNVTEVGFIPGSNSLWRELKSYRSYAYVVNESGGGMQIIDLSDVPNSVSLAGTYTALSTSHTIYIDTTNAIVYLGGAPGNQSVNVLSLADPVNPVQISTFGQIYAHDMYAQDNMVYVSEGSSGSIGIYDLTNPASPVFVHRHQIPSPGYVHNAWLTEDGSYMMTTEETNFKTVKYWDIRDLGSITLTDEYLAAPSYLAHNAHIKGNNYAYLSHYGDGIKVLDISDPYDIREVGYYDTSTGGLGCWAVYPYFDSGKIIGSDVENGLYVVYFEGALSGDLQDPLPPTDPSAYSDYTTPTSMLLSWTDPTSLVNGTPINPGDFVVEVERDGINVGSAPGGAGEFTDNGLVEGQSYAYTVYARLLANDSTSRTAAMDWIAGGSPVPGSPAEFSVRGNSTSVMIYWRNTSTNDDGTPINDIAGINLYQDDIQVATFARAPGVAGQSDSAMFTPSIPGYYSWYVTTIDDDVPLNESLPSSIGFTPLTTPFAEDFPSPGVPNPAYWINQNGDVNARGSNPPSTPYSLNLNGHPSGGDIVDLRPFDLTGLSGSGVGLTFSYEPQGTGNAPEISDSLLVFFKNSLGEWRKVRSYAGAGQRPFEEVMVDIASENPGAGTFFFSQFQVRFQSYGTSDPVQLYDDWFVDDVSLSLPTSVGSDGEQIPERFALNQNYPNPFNPSTTFEFEVPITSRVRLTLYNLLGETVRTLLDAPIEAGVHQATWDGRDDGGHIVVSGIYFYRMEAGSFVSTRKMVLLK